jgi:pimeloyl-ACP methyl ester carboxylesterase
MKDPMLNTIIHGDPTSARPLVIAHGLYGSARNWGVIAKRLSDTRQVIAVDMRNHGNSPWENTHHYADLAQDLADVIIAHGGKADILGHSMGGKATMMLALTHAELVNRIVIADIAPVAYGHSQQYYIDAMRKLDLATLTTRSDADHALRADVPQDGVRAFLLQSLDIAEKRWRLNLDVLERFMPDIIGWPNSTGRHDGPALFLRGGASDYVLPEHHGIITALFPHAAFETIDGAGHWLHAEQPRVFEDKVKSFLDM